MANPQQPELSRNRRSGRGAKTPKEPEGGAAPTTAGPAPEEGRPGVRPEAEQDESAGPPPEGARPARRPRRTTTSRAAGGKAGAGGGAGAGGKAASTGRRAGGRAADARRAPRRAGTAGVGRAGEGEPGRAEAAGVPLAPGTGRRFEFSFEPAQMAAALLFGVTPFTTSLTVTSDVLRIRYGPWSLETPLANVAGAEVTGPYKLRDIAGPPHVSLADRDVTFGTRRSRGVRIRFREPVQAALPAGLIRHPAATVTVTDPDELVDLLRTAA